MSQPVIAKIGAKVKGSLNASSSSSQTAQPHTHTHCLMITDNDHDSGQALNFKCQDKATNH